MNLQGPHATFFIKIVKKCEILYLNCRVAGRMRLMSKLNSKLRHWAIPVLATVFSASGAIADETFSLKYQESGIHEKMPGYRPHSAKLTEAAPAEVKKTPDGLTTPRWGTVPFGEKKTLFPILIDLKDGVPVKFYFDANGDGDMTNDKPVEFTEKKFKRATDGKELANYFADATFQLPFPDGTRPGKMKFYFMPERPAAIGYYSDYGWSGEVKIDGKSYPMVLDDGTALGVLKIGTTVQDSPYMGIDVDGDGKYRSKGEFAIAGKPFNIGEKYFAMAKLTSDAKFEIVAAVKPVAPKNDGPDLSPGQIAPAFTAKFTDGKEVKFPEDYKGKVVLIDFWATWCGPCIAELPNVVTNYEKYHEKGLEILGISLDREGADEKLAAFTKEHKMPWPQVFDGKYWKADVGQKYGINSIPHMILIDGDTGKIIADKDIRGEKLGPAIEKALADKKK